MSFSPLRGRKITERLPAVTVFLCKQYRFLGETFMSEASAISARRSRGGGGAARRAERTAVSVETAKYITRNIPNYEVLSEADLDLIEKNAETVLAEIGICARTAAVII